MFREAVAAINTLVDGPDKGTPWLTERQLDELESQLFRRAAQVAEKEGRLRSFVSTCENCEHQLDAVEFAEVGECLIWPLLRCWRTDG